MSTYTWEIESVDRAAGCMVVRYTHDSTTVRLNAPLPPVDEDLARWVVGFAPTWGYTRELADVAPGATGEAEVTALPEAPNVVGSWSDEYLRAMIYQVLEEIREAQV